VKLDDLARRAAEDLRDLVGPEPDGGRAALDRLDRARERRRRRQRIGTTVLAVVVAVSALALVLGAFRKYDREPAEPVPPGMILYGIDSTGNPTHWFTVRTDGSDVRDLHVSATCAVWFPRGHRILITNDAALGPRGQLRPAVVEPDGTGLRSLDATGDTDLNLGCGAVSPDGSKIAIEGFGIPGHHDVNGIYSIRATNGGGAVRLLSGPVEPPSFSPSGRRLTFSEARISDAGALYVMGAGGGKPIRITGTGTVLDRPMWSPVGGWIVFAGASGELFLVHPDGSDLHPVPMALPPNAAPQNPSWSPDGRWIVFDVTGEAPAGIYVVRTDGSGLRRILAARRVKDPVWAPAA
jgi:Tol biopolymer transport system component